MEKVVVSPHVAESIQSLLTLFKDENINTNGAKTRMIRITLARLYREGHLSDIKQVIKHHLSQKAEQLAQRGLLFSLYANTGLVKKALSNILFMQLPDYLSSQEPYNKVFNEHTSLECAVDVLDTLVDGDTEYIAFVKSYRTELSNKDKMVKFVQEKSPILLKLVSPYIGYLPYSYIHIAIAASAMAKDPKQSMDGPVTLSFDIDTVKHLLKKGVISLKTVDFSFPDYVIEYVKEKEIIKPEYRTTELGKYFTKAIENALKLDL